jgi:hypothetical protein
MKTRLNQLTGIALATTLMAAVAVAQTTKPPSVKNMAPSVIKTVPVAGAKDVDPALSEITVTFSKDMITDRMWSVCQISKETYPESGGDIHYLPDKRTCVMPVKLQPGKTYVLWFNRGQYNSFRDTGNNPAIPYMLVFETRK